MQGICSFSAYFIFDMKRKRQKKILEIISAKRIATQQELAQELARAGVKATQSSVSRDIVEMELAKVDGYYVAPQTAIPFGAPIVGIETAGDNLIVIKTEVGLAQPTALTIDRAKIDEIIGTVAGDDTILIAIKNVASQRQAIKKIIKLFTRPAHRRKPAARPAARPAAATHRFKAGRA